MNINRALSVLSLREVSTHTWNVWAVVRADRSMCLPPSVSFDGLSSLFWVVTGPQDFVAQQFPTLFISWRTWTDHGSSAAHEKIHVLSM